MALIKCPECGKEVSDNAVNCPNCGFSLNSTSNQKFCKHCGEKIDKDCIICPKCGKQVEEFGNTERNIVINNTSNSNSVANNTNTFGVVGDFISPKSRLVAFLLCLFLGAIAAHRFYVGKIGTGIIMILLMFTGIGEIWLIIDFVVIILGGFTDKNGLKIKNW